MKTVALNGINMDFTRTAVIGCAGSGKTTFAKELATLLDKKVIHLDKELWGNDWQMKENREQLHQEIISQDDWLIDGMWGSLLRPRFSRATTVIFLDYPTWLCLFREEKRRKANFGKQRDDMPQGCVEGAKDKEFIKCIKTFPKRVRPLIFKLHQDNPQVRFVRLSNPRQAKRFLCQLN